MPDTLAQNFETATAGELVTAIAAKRVSALELTEATIARIERINPPLNAVVVKDYDRAREAAKAVDARVAKGERAPLLGVPMTVKESHKVAGLPTTWGIAENASCVPDYDSTVISRLKAAGAIIVGKTNVPPNLGDWISDNPIYGRTNNPHNLGYSPGGSSGGGAAAVASGMVPIEVDTDIGGSIRIPAAFCGIYGLKTTANVVPGFDHAPPGFDGAGQSLSVLGPLARTPEDLDLVFSVIAGPAGDDAVGYTFPKRAPRHATLGDYRVLILDRHPLAQVDGEIVDALHALAAKVERAGAKVSRKSELLPDLATAHQSYASMLGTIMSRRSGAANTVSAHDFLNLIDDQFRLRRAWRRLFEDFDIVLAPIFGTASFPHPTETGWGKRFLTIDGQATPYGAQIAWQGVVTFPGLPACAMPIATSKTGLPIGVQAIGPMYEDLTTTHFARLATGAA